MQIGLSAIVGESVAVIYCNWRGETAERRIVPLHLWFGSTKWHKEPQWFMHAIDVGKNEERDFAIRDMRPVLP